MGAESAQPAHARRGYTTRIEWRLTRALLLALTLGVAAVGPVAAQGQELLGAGGAYLGVGASGIGTAELDNRLAARGYRTFGSSALALNLGAHIILPAG